MEERKILPELRFPEFKYAQSLVRFNKIIDSIVYGPRFNAKDYDENGNVKTIRGTDVNSNGEMKYEQVPKARIEEKTVEHHKLKDGDLVMITTADCGLTGVFRKQNMSFITSAYGVRIRLNNDGEPEYLKYFFQTRHAKKEVNSFIRKATVANLPGSDIRKIKLNLPNITEQQKIATFLTSVDQRIQLLEKKKAKLEAYKKGIMQKIFSQEIRFKDEKGDNFPDWEEKRLRDVCEKKSSNISANSLPKESGDFKIYGATGFLRYVDFFREEAPYISIVKDGAGVGRILLCDAKSSVLGTLDILKPKGDNDINFLYSLLSNIRFDKYITGSTIPHIYFKDYSKEKMLVPILPEQQKIAKFLSSIDKNIAQITQQIEMSKSFKKGLLQKMFV